MDNATAVTPEMVAYAEQYHAEQLKYNGWPNYETWKVDLELVSDYANSLLDDGQTFASTADLADALQEYVESIMDEQPDGIAKDYANSFLESVKWFVIAQHYADDLVPDTDPEMEAAGLEPDDDCFN